MEKVSPPPRVFTNGNTYLDCEYWRDLGEMGLIGNKFAYLLEKGMLVDVNFLIGQSRSEFSCHKLVLMASSKVFMAMFAGELAAAPNEVIEIPDVEPQAFIASIKFLYSGVLTIGDNRLTEVLYIAVKYDLSNLQDACCNLMIIHLNSDNAASVYQTAKFFNASHLQYRAYQYIRDNAEGVLKSSDFLNLTYQNVATIVKQNDLIANELDIFNAVISWGENQCRKKSIDPTGDNLRKVLEDCIYLIRYSRFLPTYISRYVIVKGIYTDEEIISIFQYSSLASVELEFMTPTRFCLNERSISLHNIKLFEVCEEPEHKKSMNFTRKMLTFSVDRDISITHLFIHGLSECSNATYKINIFLKLYENGVGWMPSEELVCIGVKGFGHLRLNLPRNLQIHRNNWCQLLFETQKTLRTFRGLAKNPTKVNCGENGDVTFSMAIEPQKYLDQIEIWFRV